MDKHEVARILEEISVFLEILGENPFKVDAYRNAARSIEGLNEPLDNLVDQNRLEEVEGIGEGIAEKVSALVRKGKLPFYEKLKKSVPKYLPSMMKLSGLGGKKIKILYEQLNIKTLEDLAKACEEGKVAELRGFGERSQKNILENIEKNKIYSTRYLWIAAAKIAIPILNDLKQLEFVREAEIAGSLRRCQETVGDLDFVVASHLPDKVMQWFTTRSEVEKILAFGTSKSSVRLKKGIQADIRVVSEKEYSFALLHFTGSKSHNIRLRAIANSLGYSLSEYGLKPLKDSASVFRRQKISEAEIYQFLHLAYIEPELREDRGEINASMQNKLPRLIGPGTLQGTFHCHTTNSDGHNTLEEMAEAAEKIGWKYLGISNHSKSSFQANGLDEERLFKEIETIRKLNRSKKFSLHLFAGLECDILKNGSMDFSNEILKELDFVIASVHHSLNLSESEMTKRFIRAIENPFTTFVGHLTGRLLLKRDPYKVNVDKIIDACIANGKIIELNCHPKRVDMDWRFWPKAKEKGLKCSIHPDAHSVHELPYALLGIQFARKGWLETEDVINTLPLREIKKVLKSHNFY